MINFVFVLSLRTWSRVWISSWQKTILVIFLLSIVILSSVSHISMQLQYPITYILYNTEKDINVLLCVIHQPYSPLPASLPSHLSRLHFPSCMSAFCSSQLASRTSPWGSYWLCWLRRTMSVRTSSSSMWWWTASLKQSCRWVKTITSVYLLGRAWASPNGFWCLPPLSVCVPVYLPVSDTWLGTSAVFVFVFCITGYLEVAFTHLHLSLLTLTLKRTYCTYIVRVTDRLA